MSEFSSGLVIGLIVGLLLGATFGAVLLGAFMAGKRNDERRERENWLASYNNDDR